MGINALAEIKENEVNMLMPVKSFTEISPLHKVSINYVQLDTNVIKDPKTGSESSPDIYKEKNGEFALRKTALMKLMAAAGIQVLDSRSVVPSTCQKCREANAGKSAAVQCGSCPARDDVAWQVVISVPEMTGAWRRVTASREIRMADAKSSMTEMQLKKFAPFRSEHVESKALNRALREALQIKPTYTLEELRKPFAVAVVSPNFNDPDLKAAVIQRITGNSDALFGTTPQRISTSVEIPMIEAGCDEAESPGAFEEPTGPTETDPFANAVECHGCGAILDEFDDPQTGHWDVTRLKTYSEIKFGVPLCRECCLKAMKEAKQS